MSLDLQTVAADVKAVQAVGDQILVQVETYLPSAMPEEQMAGMALDLLSQLLGAALTAWSNASGQPITVETVQALMPNATPLSQPDSPAASPAPTGAQNETK